jgi:hypothetical protein
LTDPTKASGITKIDRTQRPANENAYSSVFGGMAVEHHHELREKAEWHRGIAEAGDTDSREWRERVADYLERRANELEAVSKADDSTLSA